VVNPTVGFLRGGKTGGESPPGGVSPKIVASL
jgi:hypothetical protein